MTFFPCRRIKNVIVNNLKYLFNLYKYFQVITIHDLSSIYRVPLLMEEQGIVPFLIERLKLSVSMPNPRTFMRKWRDLADRVEHLRKKVVIALVGKYTKLEDSYASITKALQHASIRAGYKLELKVFMSQFFKH